jgi:ATP-binding protein involved in chromosome partitioning
VNGDSHKQVSEPGPATSMGIRKPAVWNKEPLPGVRKILIVASGKGGVGKSTTAVNLALALAREGKCVGLLDADIYGPSIPHMMHIVAKPEMVDGKMTPLENYGVRCMSIGFIMDQAAILRGPMITKALNQLLRLTRWGTDEAPLDVLIVDMPPGTGDIHLSMVQQAPVDGAIIVTTPQQVALLDARKCASMFGKVGVPIVGVIENMSGELFGHGGGKILAEEFGAPLLGNIPADLAIREASDTGKIYDGKAAAVYREMAKKL